MATTKPFADVLLDTPMEKATMVDLLAAYRAEMMQRAEQAEPELFNNDLAPRSCASSQYSSRSRGGLAPQSDVQARLDLFPKRVTRWRDFHDEVGWDAFRQEAGFGDVPVAPILFRTNIPDIVEINENDALDRLHSRAGILTPQNPNRARFLVHEHESPAKFPYGLTQDDLDELAQALMQDTSYTLDEAKEVANSAWEMACDDLVDYWELGERFPDRESSVRFRYPIIQIYVDMLRSFCKYGVLSTTDRTWFFKLDHDNVLHISDSFLSTATGRGSMRHAYACMLRRNLVSAARLTLNEEHLRAICQSDIRIVNPDWAEMLRRFGSCGGAGKTASGGRRGAALPGNGDCLDQGCMKGTCSRNLQRVHPTAAGSSCGAPQAIHQP